MDIQAPLYRQGTRSRARVNRGKGAPSVEAKAKLMHAYVNELEQLRGRPLRPGGDNRRVASLRPVAVPYTHPTLPTKRTH